MASSDKLQEQVEKLFHLAVQIAKMQLWELADENYLFGVKLTATGENAYIQTIGRQHETYGVLAVLGEASLHRLQNAQGAESLLELKMLSLTFDPLDELPPELMAQAAPLAVTINGEKMLPSFATYIPGTVPSDMTWEEAVQMEQYLLQTLEVYKRKNIDGFLDLHDEIKNCLYRTFSMGSWIDEVKRVPQNPERKDRYTLAPTLLMEFGALPEGTSGIQAELFLFPGSIGARGTIPSTAYLLLMVDEKTGLAAHELILPAPSLRKMELSVPGIILKKFLEKGKKPKHLSVIRGGKLHGLLKEMGTDLLPFKLLVANALDPLEEIMESFWESAVTGKVPKLHHEKKNPQKKRPEKKKRVEKKKETQPGKVLLVKAALYSDKSIYRKIAIHSDQTLHQLHLAIFDAFDREEEHLYTFFFPKMPTNSLNVVMKSPQFSPPTDDDFFSNEECGDTTETTVGSLNLKEKQKFYYLFDWGDEWWHELTFEGECETSRKILPEVILKKGDSPPQ